MRAGAEDVLQIRKPRKKRSVIGWELRRQLNSPGRVCWSIGGGFDSFERWMFRLGLCNVIDLKLACRDPDETTELAGMRLSWG